MRQSYPLRIGSVPCRRARGRAREREDAMSCVVWEGLFSARGAASQPGDVRHGAVGGGGGGGETRRVCRDSGVSLSALQAARRSVPNTPVGTQTRGRMSETTQDKSEETERDVRDSKTRRLLMVLKEIILEEKGGRTDDRKGDREVFWGGSLTLRRLRPSSRRATGLGPQRRLNLGLGCQSCLLPRMPRKCAHPPRARHCVLPALENSTGAHILPPTTRIPGEVDGLPTGNLSQSGGRSSNGAAADDL